MNSRRWILKAALAASVGIVALPVLAQDAKEEAPKKGARILFLTQSKGYPHGSVTRKNGALAPAEEAITKLGVVSGVFRVDCTQDAAKDFTKENLQNYDIVFFYTTGNLPIKEEDLKYFYDEWLKQKGHGFVGAHSAADTYHNDKRYWDMIGGTFENHPWGSGDTVTISVHDQDHPISKPWGAEFTIKDEIYNFKNWQPEKVHLLMSLNMAKTQKKMAKHIPIAWCKEYGQGKCFHMSLGHNETVWQNETFQQSMLGGIKWVLNQEKGDATPNPEVSKAQDEKAKADTAAAEKEKAEKAAKDKADKEKAEKEKAEKEKAENK